MSRLTFLRCATAIRILLLLVVSLAMFPPALEAQTPGYLGKRFSVQGTFLSSPGIWGPTVNNRGIGAYNRSDFSLGWNWKVQGSAGYTLTRELEVIGGVAFARTGVIAEFVETISVSNSGAVSSNYTDVFLTANMTFIELGLKRYGVSNGSLAPFGSYMQYLGGIALISGEVVEREDQINQTAGEPLGELQMNTRCVAPYVGVELGQNLIFFDRFTVNYGVRLSYPLVPYGIFFFEDPFEQAAAKRFLSTNAFSFNVGTGFIF